MATADIRAQPPIVFSFQLTTRFELGSRDTVHNFRAWQQLQNVTSVFASVELVSATVAFTFAPLEGGSVHVAITEFDACVQADMNRSLYQFTQYFARDSPVTQHISLPEGHSFGHEVKHDNIATSSPAIVVRFQNLPAGITATGNMTVTAVIRVTGLAPAFRLL